MIRSPLRYPGGKSRAVEKITALIPDFAEFREPFVGGASVFINLKQRLPTRAFWMNDNYKELATFWCVLRDEPEKLIELIWKWKRDFSDGKVLHLFLQANKPKFDKIETAAMFFIFNRITFSGTTEAGGFSQQAFDKRFTDSSIERLTLIPQVLRDVKITDFDYQQIVETTGESVFIFLDPPYFSATSSALYGKNGDLHKTFDHERFAEIMKKCSHKWLITYDDSPRIRKLFSFANVINWNLMYGMRNQTASSNQLGDELFIANYDLAKIENNQTLLTFHK